MDFISGQKESFYHKNYLFDDFPGKQIAITSRVALLLNDKVFGGNRVSEEIF